MDDIIRDIERKFLSGRKRSDHCAKSLTPEERETYARYLESKGHLLGAASFRDYVDEVSTGKRVKAKSNFVEVELYNLAGELERKVEVEKGSKSVDYGDRQFILKGKKVKTKFYETLVRVKI